VPGTTLTPNAYGSAGDGLGVQLPPGVAAIGGATEAAIGENRFGERLNCAADTGEYPNAGTSDGHCETDPINGSAM
jgi:hypothetical protein